MKKMRPGILPFDMDYLTDEMIERAKTELGETDETRKQALMQFRELIQKNNKLVATTDERYLLMYLRNRKFKVMEAMNQLQKLLKWKTSHSMFNNVDFSRLHVAVEHKILSILPYRDHDGAIIVVIQTGCWDSELIELEAMLQTIAVFIYACIYMHAATQICGIKFIVDVNGIGLKHMKYILPKYIKLLVMALTGGFPARIKAVYIIKDSILVRPVWNIVQYMISEKLRNRVQFFRDCGSLHKEIDPELLPVELEGVLDCDSSFFLKKFEENKDRHDTLWKFTYDVKS